MPVCCIANCPSRTGATADKLRNFTFPKEPHLRKEWMTACHKSDKSFNADHGRVCEKHFEVECFEVKMTKPKECTGRAGTMVLKLKAGSIPTKSLILKRTNKGKRKHERPKRKKYNETTGVPTYNELVACIKTTSTSTSAVSSSEQSDKPVNVEQNMYRKWIERCRNSQLSSLQPSLVFSLYSVCGRHFVPGDFQNSNRLRPSAVPKLELPKSKTIKAKKLYNQLSCCVRDCNSKKGKDQHLSFHHFPSPRKCKVAIATEAGIILLDRRAAWKLKLQINEKNTNNMVVCSRHFAKEDFLFPGVPVKTPKLKKYAVPSRKLPKGPEVLKANLKPNKNNEENTESSNPSFQETKEAEENNKNKDDISISDFDSLCRLCLNFDEGNHLNILDFKYANKNLKDVVVCSSESQLKWDDVLPRKICLKCLKMVLSTFDFKMQCQQSDIKLQEICKAAGHDLKANVNAEARTTTHNRSKKDFHEGEPNFEFIDLTESCLSNTVREIEEVEEVAENQERNLHLCKMCDSVLIGSAEVATHVCRNSKFVQVNLRQCAGCSSSFYSVPSYRNHLKFCVSALENEHNHCEAKDQLKRSASVQNNIPDEPANKKPAVSDKRKDNSISANFSDKMNANQQPKEAETQKPLSNILKVYSLLEKEKLEIVTETNQILREVKSVEFLEDDDVICIESSEEFDEKVKMREKEKCNTIQTSNKIDKCQELKKSKNAENQIPSILDGQENKKGCNEWQNVFQKEIIDTQKVKQIPQQIRIAALNVELQKNNKEEIPNQNSQSRDASKEQQCSLVLKSVETLKAPTPVNKRKDPYVCGNCGKGFSKKPDLLNHLPLHVLTLKPVRRSCSKRSQSQEFPHKHKQIDHNISVVHGDETSNSKNKFLCSLCGLRLTTRSSLEVHMRKHTGERPFTCEYCGWSFTSLAGLSQHASMHKSSKLYVCEMCGKSFKERKHLHVHMRTHTGEKPFVCNICSRLFAVKCNLQAHMRLHMYEIIYKCKECCQEFCDRRSFVKHKFTCAKKT